MSGPAIYIRKAEQSINVGGGLKPEGSPMSSMPSPIITTPASPAEVPTPPVAPAPEGAPSVGLGQPYEISPGGGGVVSPAEVKLSPGEGWNLHSTSRDPRENFYWKEHNNELSFWHPGAHTSHPEAYKLNTPVNEITDNEYLDATKSLKKEIQARDDIFEKRLGNSDFVINAVLPRVNEFIAKEREKDPDLKAIDLNNFRKFMGVRNRREIPTPYGSYYADFDRLDDKSLANALSRVVQGQNLPADIKKQIRDSRIHHHQKGRTRAENALLKALTLWTDGEVPFVRNPEKFDPEDISTINGPGFYEMDATKEDYEDANHILSRLAQLPLPEPQKVFRGISLPADISSQLKNGHVFDLGKAMSSYAKNMDIALEFAQRNASLDNKKKARKQGEGNFVPNDPVIFRFNTAKGYDIGPLSFYPEEEEILLGGKVKVNDVKKEDPEYGDRPVYIIEAEPVQERARKALNDDVATEYEEVPAEVQEALSDAFSRRHHREGKMTKGFEVIVK